MSLYVSICILRDILEDTGFAVFQNVQTVPLSMDRIGQNMQEQTLIPFHCILLYIMYHVRLKYKLSRYSVKCNTTSCQYCNTFYVCSGFNK